MGPITIHLASQSPVKKKATLFAAQKMYAPKTIGVFGHDCRSGVNNQPLGYDETLKGATNRLEAIIDRAIKIDNTILVSMENGIRYSEEENAYYDFVQVIVKKGDLTFSHTEDCCQVPTTVINAISRDRDHRFLETWGEAAKRIGMAKDANNPHQEAIFGGTSRTDHLSQALCIAIGKLKEKMMEQINISRVANINSNKSQKNYAKRGVLFATPTKRMPSKPIDLYNQGCPIKTWNIDPANVKRNDFKIFSTGDAFSILSPDVEINGANINIHVGVEHAKYSSLALLQEALQLCRCVYEHGAGEVTIALPEKFHPVLHANDFNLLLMSLFKASGANKIYFYDKNYTGILDETTINAIEPITLSQQSDIAGYLQTIKNESSLDSNVMNLTRKSYLNRALSKFNLNQTNLIDHISGKDAPSQMMIPEIKDQPHVLLCCSTNKPLAEKIAASLHLRGEMVKLYQIEGKGAEATIQHDAEICGAIVTIVQSTRPNPDDREETQEYENNGASSYFFETAMIARQAHLRGADKINLINPYQFNARSDKAEDNPKGKTGAYVQHNGLLLGAAGINHVITAECHDNHTMSGSYTGKNRKGSAVSALSIMATKIVSDWLENPNQSMQGQLRLVTPDAGATKRTNELTQKLQAILGKKLCKTRILGEKQRNSHEDDSALINSLNSGTIGINANDKYLITDDETATGNTLCQAIANLKKNGANDISVIVVHNNMPLDWLLRQLCLARFLHIGVNDLHFSDTQEMGILAKSYEEMIYTYSQKSLLSTNEVEEQVFAWFKKNICEDYVEFIKFKAMFTEFQSRIHVHSLAYEFASQVMTKRYVVKHDAVDSLLFFQSQPNRLQNKKESTTNDQQAISLNRYSFLH